MRFPTDDYTPHGYLDTPTHSRNLTPRGVLRSFDAGFRWHYPAYAASYGGRRETYRAGFRVALNGALELAAFQNPTSPYHSANLIEFDLRRGAATARVQYHLVGEHALRATLDVRGAARVALHVEYTRLLSASGEWGESGLVGRMEGDQMVLQGFEDGDAFVLWASRPLADVGITGDPADVARWAAETAPGLPADGFVTVLGDRGATVALHGVVAFQTAGDERLEVLLARGKTADQARERLREARRAADGERARKVAEDDAFWARAPRLEGHWPDHWRRGLVYDLETLRMMVKAPVGIYRRRWDAMQIQAPRVVLAEAAFDALLLGYADPALAQELMEGTFLDAPAPNVPCSREDGSYNMVAADGAVCGTAPEWGYPWLVLEWLLALHPDAAWLERLYPRLAEYLGWWLAHRQDAQGWLGYACSWESGQDDSPRFGAQPLGGGHPVRHVRPVDLHAAMAHAARVMARFAARLARPADQRAWADHAEAFAHRTGQLWDGARYADFDARAGRFSPVQDVMLLAPLALGVAPAEHAAASRRQVQAVGLDDVTWPMFAWTAVEAAMAAGLPDKASHLAWAICDRAYGFWDARVVQPQRTLPGISCEYWPASGRCGGEGYGWGAFTIHLLIHTLVGFTPTDDGVTLRPNLPAAWREPGHRYTLHLWLRDQPVTISLQPLPDQRVRVLVNGHSTDIAWAEAVSYAWPELQAAE